MSSLFFLCYTPTFHVLRKTQTDCFRGMGSEVNIWNEEKSTWEKYLIRNFMICIPKHMFFLGGGTSNEGKLKGSVMCHVWGKHKRMQSFGEETWRKLTIWKNSDETVILKWILKKSNRRVLTGFIWLGMGIGGGFHREFLDYLRLLKRPKKESA